MNNIKMSCKKVEAYHRESLLEEEETILDDIDVQSMINNIIMVEYYFRDKIVCPFARGNWVLDIYFRDGSLLSYKFNKDIPEERFVKYLRPLLDGFNRS